MYDYDMKNNEDYDQFKCLKEDKFFINNTTKDLLLIYPDGTMTVSLSKMKMHENTVDDKK